MHNVVKIKFEDVVGGRGNGDGIEPPKVPAEIEQSSATDPNIAVV